MIFGEDRERSGQGRRPVADDADFRGLEGGKRETAGGDEARRAGIQVERNNGNDCGEGENGVTSVVAPLAAVLLGSALDGEEVVTDRDHGKQDCNQDRDGDDLPTAVCTPGAAEPEPKANHQEGESRPSEIEKDFHLLAEVSVRQF